MSAVKTSAETMEAVCNVGLAKSKMTLLSNLILAFMAGAYIGFGSLLALRIAGGMPLETWGSLQRLVFGGVFPCGLLLVLVAGADLFTGDCMFMPSGVAKHGVGINKFFRILILAWIGNLIGSIVVAWLGNYTGLMADAKTAAYAVGVANGKTVLPFGVAFVRGIFCNWLVCLAIYMALSAPDGVSKTIMLWPPITAFVALGFEHSVANMTFIPLGIFIGNTAGYANLVAGGAAPLTATWGGFFITNLIPVTLGNFIGGSIFVGMAYYLGNGIKKAVKA
ncbi:MAG: formate/nitrite transporter family protein [Deltaproteobacteria bacterium]|jgi:formate/nitrite transporter|nr:formate/nitrite transporter family protein [Deltaproteobacteria bacterium]